MGLTCTAVGWMLDLGVLARSADVLIPPCCFGGFHIDVEGDDRGDNVACPVASDCTVVCTVTGGVGSDRLLNSAYGYDRYVGSAYVSSVEIGVTYAGNAPIAYNSVH